VARTAGGHAALPADARHPEAGFSIVLAVTVILILLVLGLAMVSLVVEDSDLALNHVRSNQAFYAAHAGVEYAVLKLASNWAWGGLASPGKNVGAGSFWIAPPDTLDENGAPLPTGRKRVISTGVVGSAMRTVQVQISSGGISTFAGNGLPGNQGDGGQATAARLKTPMGVYVTSNGDVYITDNATHQIRKVTAATGIITTVAGNGNPGSTGDGGAATSARLNSPEDVFVTSSGDIYIADTLNHKIRRVAAATGIITTVAGTGTAGSTGNGGAATAATLSSPHGIVVASNGDYYISERGGNVIRKVTAATGIITAYAGTGTAGYSGDGGAATAAKLSQPQGLALASNGDLSVADTGNNVVRVIRASTGVITTFAGTGTAGYTGDGGAATAARLQGPQAISLDAQGNLLIADTGNNVIRKVQAGSGTISTVAGTGSAGFSGDGGAATSAQIDAPRGVGAASTGTSYYISDAGNRRVRKVNGVLSVVAWVETRT
jgi:hypothetical protein